MVLKPSLRARKSSWCSFKMNLQEFRLDTILHTAALSHRNVLESSWQKYVSTSTCMRRVFICRTTSRGLPQGSVASWIMEKGRDRFLMDLFATWIDGDSWSAAFYGFHSAAKAACVLTWTCCCCCKRAATTLKLSRISTRLRLYTTNTRFKVPLESRRIICWKQLCSVNKMLNKAETQSGSIYCLHNSNRYIQILFTGCQMQHPKFILDDYFYSCVFLIRGKPDTDDMLF